eukprot:scaffold90997_cov21-Prasinocladus_malaysianus.AAC.1
MRSQCSSGGLCVRSKISPELTGNAAILLSRMKPAIFHSYDQCPGYDQAFASVAFFLRQPCNRV